MFDLLKARLKHGYQAIPDLTKAAVADNFPGFPIIRGGDEAIWEKLEELCPTRAISGKSIDLGLCVFCGECGRAYPETVIFCSMYKISADKRELLVIEGGMSPERYQKEAVTTDNNLAKIFGHSFKLRSVSAGGCAACELELNACSNVNFDMGRFGLELAASPRHADGVIVTGPITSNMAYALQQTWEATPEPKVLILAGSCAISGGLFADSAAVDRSFLERVQSVLYIPGCPIHPLTVINGLLRLLGRG
jgi:Ni,Fe-hydrogenase III small subunit